MLNPENVLIALFLFCLAVQLGYHWLIFIKLAKATPGQMTSDQPAVSIVIAARNEELQLPSLLEALKIQEYPDFEVIVVNDRSSDNTGPLLEHAKLAFSQLKVVHIAELPTGWTGKKYAVKRGIEAAGNEIILLTDADCLPCSNQWIAQMAAGFSHHTDIVLGFSPYLSRPTLLNQFIQFETLHTALQYLSYALAGFPYMGVGRNLAYRKTLFDKAGFDGDEKFTGGDDDIFVNRHATPGNTTVALTYDSQVNSIPKTNWSDYLKQKIRHLSAGKRYHKKDQTRLGAFSLVTITGWVLFIYLLATTENTALILVTFGVRSLSFYSIFTHSGQKLKVKLSYWALPLFDLCYTVSYPVVGLIALTAKRIRWT